jgi:hypothetical protein
MSTIQITYSTLVELDLQEVCESLDIRMEHINTITTSGNVLNVFMVSGSLLHYEFDHGEICDAEMDDQNPTTIIKRNV